MLIYVVTFPRHYHPRKIAYKTYEQAHAVCESHNIQGYPIKIIYLELDETIISFKSNR